MPILNHLKNLTLGPEDIRQMTAAYEQALHEQALHELGLIDRTDPITEVIAKKIIEVVQTGERNPARIARRALLELGIPMLRESRRRERTRVNPPAIGGNVACKLIGTPGGGSAAFLSHPTPCNAEGAKSKEG